MSNWKGRNNFTMLSMEVSLMSNSLSIWLVHTSAYFIKENDFKEIANKLKNKKENCTPPLFTEFFFETISYSK